jgi:hypothetical protein
MAYIGPMFQRDLKETGSQGKYLLKAYKRNQYFFTCANFFAGLDKENINVNIDGVFEKL